MDCTVGVRDSPGISSRELTHAVSWLRPVNVRQQAPANTICNFFAMGGCNRGKNCPFSHVLRQEAPEGVDVSGGFFISGMVANYEKKQASHQLMPPSVAEETRGSLLCSACPNHPMASEDPSDAVVPTLWQPSHQESSFRASLGSPDVHFSRGLTGEPLATGQYRQCITNSVCTPLHILVGSNIAIAPPQVIAVSNTVLLQYMQRIDVSRAAHAMEEYAPLDPENFVPSQALSPLMHSQPVIPDSLMNVNKFASPRERRRRRRKKKHGSYI